METERERARTLWEADRARLMVTQPFLALLAMQLDLVPVRDPRLPTAATDGRGVFVDIDFLQGLSRDERLFVLAHEVWHCAGRHFLRRGTREPERWNLAADHEVNALLQEQGLAVPADAVLYPEMAGENAETVYGWLEARPERQPSRAPWADVHEALPSAEEGSDHALMPAPGDWRPWPQRLVAAAQQAERRGTLPAGVRRQVQAARDPQLPWQEILRRFLARGLTAKRWTPPNRRFAAQGLYLPGYRRQPRLDIAVAIDTSGSTQPYLEYFLAEVNGIVKSFGDYRIRLLQCDAVVHSDTLHTPACPLAFEGIPLGGKGGTDLRPIFDRLESGADGPAALVTFTDRPEAAPTIKPQIPTCWALTGRGCKPARWGVQVNLGV